IQSYAKAVNYILLYQQIIRLDFIIFHFFVSILYNFQVCNRTKELGFIFINLHINKIKARKGRKIEYLEFTFDAEKRIHSKRQPQMKDIDKQKQFISREKTPQWLKERSYHQEIQNEEYDPQFEEKRKEFSKQLEVDWKE
ncbi:MAG: hypothetical protein E7C74_10680, partial [Staphylococcus sp.]|nr:hypothetical protein [Staphylococcus sp.]